MSERTRQDASDHSSPQLSPHAPEALFDLGADFSTFPEPVTQPIPEVTPAVARTRREASLARHATIGEVKLEGRVPKTALELARTLRLEAVSETGDDAMYERAVSKAYGELGGGLQEYIANPPNPNTLLRRIELSSNLATYQDWYKEFDTFAESGVFEVDDSYRNMDSGQRRAYFLHLFDIIDTATNRIGLIGREEKPSQNPTITERYGKKSDEELQLYAKNLTDLRSHAYETQVVHAMFSELDVNVDAHGTPHMPTWLLQKIREQVRHSKQRGGDKRRVTFTGKGMTFSASASKSSR